MTTKEEILALAGECGIQNDYISEDQAVEAFYHAARKDLEEQYASMTKSFFDVQAQLREALALESKWRVEATGLRQQLAEKDAEIERLEEERDDALRGPWAEWAEKSLKIIREHTGYDGYDDQYWVDLPNELAEAFREMEAEIERLKAMQARYISEREDILTELNKEQESGTELRQRLAAGAAAPSPKGE